MQALKLLQQLIPYPSVSSVSNCEITSLIGQWLVDRGFETERVDYTDAQGVSKSSVIARRGPPERGLAWFGHSDVVPVETWAFPRSGPWTPWIENNRLYGRGSCDMKGSIACMLAAIDGVTDPQRAALHVTVTADEEVGMMGARRIVESSRLFRELVAMQTPSIIGEPTCLEVVHAHKGGRAIRVTSTGRAAHSSTGLGVNANMGLIPFLQEIHRLNQEMESSAAWRDERFQPPTPTLNLVIRDSNSALNITSAQSECLVYFRPMPGQNCDPILDHLRSVAESLSLQFEVIFCGEPLYTEPTNPVIRELLSISGTPASKTVAYGTDGAVMTELRNLVVFGPGDIAQAHTDDEWISLEQLELGTRMYRDAIRHWCC